jgi:DNA-binding HxlR family transcriptional regulator
MQEPNLVPDALTQANPARNLVDRLGNKWSLLVIAVVAAQPIRFGLLRRRIEGVSQKMLSQTLRSLERDGLMDRRILTARPLAVEYRLTALGESLAPVAITLKDWAEANVAEVETANAAYAARSED